MALEPPTLEAGAGLAEVDLERSLKGWAMPFVVVLSSPSFRLNITLFVVPSRVWPSGTECGGEGRPWLERAAWAQKRRQPTRFPSST